MKKILSILLPTLFLPVAALLAVSCVDEEPDLLAGEAWPLVIYADIDGSAAHTRATRMEIHDLWSYVGFVDGDEMGFYSSGGDWTVDNGKGNFDNLKLQYKDKQFNDPENGVEFSPSHMEGSKIYMYYPYEPDMNTTGLELRNNLLRCIDYLSSDSITLDGVDDDGKHMALFGAFKHAFSELIIMRGEGFNDPPSGKERITAVLNVGCTHIRVEINTDNGWSCSPQLVYATNTHGLSEEDARSWDAWQGGNYGITTEDPEGKPAWYVIVPTLPGNHSIVEYIELYDNEGYLQRVSSLKLRDGNTKYVAPGWRYPMEITMKELVPTVNPFRVVPWEDDVDLTDERKRGINNLAEFEWWVSDYNAWRLDKGNPDKSNALLKYGDKLVDSEGNISWHFYLLSDLDLSKYEPLPGNDGEADGFTENSNCIVPELADVLDGKSTTLVNGKFINHTIRGLTKTFIETISPGGSLQNLDFVEPDVRNNEASESPAGILVNTLENGEVLNCNILNGTLFNPGGPAGMVAGAMVGGKIGNCTLSGSLFAGITKNRIAGTASDDSSFENNDADAVIDDK